MDTNAQENALRIFLRARLPEQDSVHAERLLDDLLRRHSFGKKGGEGQ